MSDYETLTKAELVQRLQEFEQRDNGTGFPKMIPKEKGMGWRTLQSRAGTIGGSVSIEKDLAGGTTVLCSVPGRRELDLA
jgi:nitrate/nitrite-specific signal transduction histidine kinase